MFSSIKSSFIILKNPVFEFNDRIELADIRVITKKVEQELCQIKSSKHSFKNKSFFVFIELIQNTFRHGVQKNNIHIAVNNLENKLYYLFENVIYNDEVSKLKKSIEELNSSDKIQLNKFFKKKLTSGTIGMAAAGIGLIEIRRKTKNKFLINLKKIDKNYSLFSIITAYNIEQ